MSAGPKLLAALALAAVAFPLSAQPQSRSFAFPQACAACHGSVTKYPVRGARSQYLTSGHRNLPDASYSNGDGCQRCHTSEGFIEYAATGKVDPKAFVPYPSEVGCFTCHAPHERGDFSLRKQTAVRLANGVVYDKGKSNLCANCHQARVAARDEVRARPIVAAPWGAHHGPQSDMLAGTNAYEFPGKDYSSSAHTLTPGADCVTCHMALPKGRYGLAPSIGGHSWRIAGEVHEEPKVNAAGCAGASCHAGMKQVAGKELFEIKAPADYDGDGALETVQEEVEGLLERLLNKQGSGLLQKIASPLYDAKGAFIANNKSPQPIEVVAAVYNYKFVLEDKSKGVHNTKYAVQLLMDSIKALDKGYDDSKRPR